MHKIQNSFNYTMFIILGLILLMLSHFLLSAT